MLWTGQRAMKCWTKSIALATVAVVTTLTPTVARADADRVRFLADKLKSDDFRVRTNAALALGATSDDLAVEPLCQALSDGSEVVRQASAVAMKRLGKPQALGCLKDRASREGDDAVKSAIARAIESLPAAGGSDDAIKNNPNAKYYIAISSISNATTRSQVEVESVVMKAIKAKLEAAGNVQIAPPKESADSARDAMKKRKLNGFYLAVAVDRFDYSGGNLRVKVKIGVFTYPGKSLLGNVDKGLTKEGVSSGDKSSEDQLLDLAAGLASEQFAQNASAFL
ncbi:MAG: lyase repeat-like domain protein [Labilithrix sp.]|nr:lyase repeat-like domain protein [Labilithrix sp.]